VLLVVAAERAVLDAIEGDQAPNEIQDEDGNQKSNEPRQFRDQRVHAIENVYVGEQKEK